MKLDCSGWRLPQWTLLSVKLLEWLHMALNAIVSFKPVEHEKNVPLRPCGVDATCRTSLGLGLGYHGDFGDDETVRVKKDDMVPRGKASKGDRVFGRQALHAALAKYRPSLEDAYITLAIAMSTGRQQQFLRLLFTTHFRHPLSSSQQPSPTLHHDLRPHRRTLPLAQLARRSWTTRRPSLPAGVLGEVPS